MGIDGGYTFIFRDVGERQAEWKRLYRFRNGNYRGRFVYDNGIFLLNRVVIGFVRFAVRGEYQFEFFPAGIGRVRQLIAGFPGEFARDGAIYACC